MVESKDAIKSSLRGQLENYSRLVPTLAAVVFMLCTSILLVLRLMSDESADIYETNLMRRLSGLLYLDNKVVGDIKEKIKKKL